MLIQVNTDRNIDGHEKLGTQVHGAVEDALSRFTDRISRVEVHLSDENGNKSGQHDKRCMMEARIEGRPPLAVTFEAATLNLAIDGAAERLNRLVVNTLERLQDESRRATDPPAPEPDHTEHS